MSAAKSSGSGSPYRAAAPPDSGADEEAELRDFCDRVGVLTPRDKTGMLVGVILSMVAFFCVLANAGPDSRVPPWVCVLAMVLIRSGVPGWVVLAAASRSRRRSKLDAVR